MTDQEKIFALAEKVMGWKPCSDTVDKCAAPGEYLVIPPHGLHRTRTTLMSEFGKGNFFRDTWAPWNPLENIAHAFEVVDAMHARGYRLSMVFWSEAWEVIFKLFCEARSTSPARAICEAALLAVQS